MAGERETVRITCSLCEAACAALMDMQDGQITTVRPDSEDPLSGGFICAKGAAIPELENDPDRLHTPLVRRNGQLEPVSWQEAFAYIQARLPDIQAQHGRDAVAVYTGNGASHGLNMYLYLGALIEAMGTKNFYTSGTIDQIPMQAVSALLFGSPSSVPIPDVDRCQVLWIMGANPAESNGSLLTAPGMLMRLQNIQKRGGRVIVIDPRRTMTAKRADEHLMIRPSSDAAFLAAVAQVILEQGPVPSQALELCGDLSALAKLLEHFSPERVAAACDLSAETIRRLALELRETKAAAVYGRMGTTTQGFSSLVCWLIDMVNILAGNMDTVGGAMFPSPLYAQENTLGSSGRGKGKRIGRWRSRVHGIPEVLGEFPVRCLPDEIETPGEGQIKAMFVIGGNPALSNPDAARIGAALDKLELLVCMDIYLNETSQRAHVVLPGQVRLTKCSYSVYFYQFAVRHYGRYTPPYRALAGDERSDNETLLRLAAIAGGKGLDVDLEAADDAGLQKMILSELRRPGSRIAGRDADEIFRMLGRLGRVERRLDFALRIGPHGDAFGARDGIKFESLLNAPQGLDLGPLQPRLPEILRTASGTIEWLQPFVAEELKRLLGWLDEPRSRFVMVGRRQIRSHNSWMHNLNKLKHVGRSCVLSVNDADASDLGLASGDIATVTTRIGSVDVEIQTTADIARGVVSLPHGWGHRTLTNHQHVAAANPGVNVNALTDKDLVDPLTNTASVNGYPVGVSRARLPA